MPSDSWCNDMNACHMLFVTFFNKPAIIIIVDGFLFFITARRLYFSSFVIILFIIVICLCVRAGDDVAPSVWSTTHSPMTAYFRIYNLRRARPHGPLETYIYFFSFIVFFFHFSLCTFSFIYCSFISFLVRCGWVSKVIIWLYTILITLQCDFFYI